MTGANVCGNNFVTGVGQCQRKVLKKSHMFKIIYYEKCFIYPERL